ncbi:M64 family metallopeptidase [Dokdonella sp. MW10]|uniref:M64 family metallopeptidase n=1 Tax=Dokdonella sp. MW10 TaxID=2992926 RepID=UPI003F7FE87C
MDKSRRWGGALLAGLGWAGAAWAVPAHYVVFELDPAGRARPVFHAQVEVAADASARRDAWRASDTETERVTWRPVRDGVRGADRQVEVPRFLRAEFAGHDGETIEHHANVEDDARAFVLRVPVAEGEVIEIVTDAGTQQLDLAALAREADRLPLAGTPLARVEATEGDPSGPSGNRVDVLVLGDGYTAAQQATFNTQAANLRTAMFNVSPYKEYANFVNWRTGFVASVQSGADHPPYQSGCTTATCCADAAAQNDPAAGTFVDTAFDAKYCTSQIHRLLTVNGTKLYAAAAGYPDWDHILVTVNDPVYGGAGGSFAVTSAHGEAPKVVIHEYGHSFHRLADEYDSPYPGFPACSDTGATPNCEANVTNQTDPALVKWRTWFTPGIAIPTPSGTPGTGLFQGARYQTSGMYRPVHNTCLMRSLITTFCTVCRQEYVKRLYRGGFGVPAGGIDLIEPGSEVPSPAAPVAYQAGTQATFSADILRPVTGSVALQWYLDGAPIAGATGESYLFQQIGATPATRTLELRAIDETPFVAASMADGLVVHSRTWTIQVGNDRVFAHGFE